MLGFIVESNQQDHELHWTVHTVPGGLIMQVFGQAEAHNESDWQRMLDEAAAATPESSTLVVDAGSLDFMAAGRCSCWPRRPPTAAHRESLCGSSSVSRVSCESSPSAAWTTRCRRTRTSIRR